MTEASEDAVAVLRDLPVPMRDGVVLRADVYLPHGAEPLPVIAQRTPYDKANYEQFGQALAARGFVYVVQDVRGQFGSEGLFDPWLSEAVDGYETVEWAARLPGTNGRVGLFGSSYQGYAAWLAASLAPPHLAALAASVAPSDVYEDWVWPSGAFSLAFNSTWVLNNVGLSSAARLPDGEALQERMRRALSALAEHDFADRPDLDLLEAAPYYSDWLQHPLRDAYWTERTLLDRYPGVVVPTLSLGGWYDVFCAGTIANFRQVGAEGGSTIARRARRLVVGPWQHNAWGRTVGDVDFGPAAEDRLLDEVVRWFDAWLRDDPSAGSDEPSVSTFCMGENRWVDGSDWPPRTTELALHLREDGRLAPEAPTVDGASTSFAYDPADPTPSVGGQSCCYPPAPMGPRDQRAVEERPDVLVFTTAPLERPLTVAGQPRVVLHARSTAVTADFTAKLVDVHPDGRAINLTEGICPAVAGEGAGPLEITLRPTHAAFLAGHAVRLELAGANFPAYERNPHVGVHTVRHDRTSPSRLLLPRI